MKRFNYVLTLIMASCISINVFSQALLEGHLGTAIPLGDFADDNIYHDNAAGGAMGLNIGATVSYPFLDFGLSLFAGADFNYNGLQKSVKEDLEDQYSNWGLNPEIKYNKYVNIPLLIGVKYTYELMDNFGLYGDLGLGIDIFKMTDMTIELGGEEFIASYDMSAKLCAKIGAGVIINERFMAGIHYNALGMHTIEGKVTNDGDSEELPDEELKINMLTISIGVKF